MSTVSLDSKPISGVQTPHTFTLISHYVIGHIRLTVWITIMGFVRSVFISEIPVLTHLLQEDIFLCSPAAQIHTT
jgi:hypothetical protein